MLGVAKSVHSCMIYFVTFVLAYIKVFKCHRINHFVFLLVKYGIIYQNLMLSKHVLTLHLAVSHVHGKKIYNYTPSDLMHCGYHITLLISCPIIPIIE